jgi:hypothetical protein
MLAAHRRWFILGARQIGDDAKVMSVTARWDTAITPGRIVITVAAAN